MGWKDFFFGKKSSPEPTADAKRVSVEVRLSASIEVREPTAEERAESLRFARDAYALVARDLALDDADWRSVREAFLADYGSGGRSFHRLLEKDWPASLRWSAAEEHLLAKAVDQHQDEVAEVSNASFEELLRGRKVDGLRALAKSAGVQTAPGARKADLIAAIVDGAAHLDGKVRAEALAQIAPPSVNRRWMAALLYRRLVATAYRLRRLQQLQEAAGDSMHPFSVEVILDQDHCQQAPCGWENGQSFSHLQLSLIERWTTCSEPDCPCDFRMARGA